MMYTKAVAATTAKVMDILARGKSYQWRFPGREWSEPIDLDKFNQNVAEDESASFSGDIEIREAEEPPAPFECWVNVYEDGAEYYVYNSKEIAQHHALGTVKRTAVHMREVVEGEQPTAKRAISKAEFDAAMSAFSVFTADMSMAERMASALRNLGFEVEAG